MSHDDVPVLVVGGSLVGLSAAVFLGQRGVRTLVVERHRGTAIHPRAALVSQRTMETYRAVGLQEEIEEAAAREFVQNGAIVSVESLGGKELDWYFRTINEGVEDISPCARIFVTQIGLEPILLAKAKELGSRIEYASEAVAIDQDGDGVTATIRPRDGGDDWTVRAQYAIGADGTRSPTRERLGIGQLGHGSFSDSITIYFRADVTELLGDRNLSVIYVFNPRLVGFFRFSIDGQAGFLVVNATVDEDGNRSTSIGEDMSEDDVHRLRSYGARRARPPGRDRERAALVRLRGLGRALHRRPHLPRRRLRARDAADGWVRRQHRRPGRLRPRVEARRRARRHGRRPACSTRTTSSGGPVGSFATEQAYTRYVLRLDPGLGQEDLMPIVGEAAVEIGYRYLSDAVQVEPGDDGAMWEDPLEPTAAPGMRAPHLCGRPERRAAVAARPLRAALHRPRRRRGRPGARRPERPARRSASTSTPTAPAPTSRTVPAGSASSTASATTARCSSARTASSRGGPARAATRPRSRPHSPPRSRAS